jgi:hypothetical protein
MRYTSPFDKFLELYDRVEGAPLAASTNTTPILFDITAQPNCSCFVASAGYTGYVAGTAEWQIEVQVSDEVDGDFVTVGSVIVPGDKGTYSAGISGAGAYTLNPDARYVRLVATKVGAPGNITMGAYLGK